MRKQQCSKVCKTYFIEASIRDAALSIVFAERTLDLSVVNIKNHKMNGAVAPLERPKRASTKTLEKIVSIELEKSEDEFEYDEVPTSGGIEKSLNQAQNSDQPRRRGRPRKHPLPPPVDPNVVIVKRPRGRPKGRLLASLFGICFISLKVWVRLLS